MGTGLSGVASNSQVTAGVTKVEDDNSPYSGFTGTGEERLRMGGLGARQTSLSLPANNYNNNIKYNWSQITIKYNNHEKVDIFQELSKI